MGDSTPSTLRRNFALGVVNGAGYSLAETLIDPALVLTWFLSHLAAPNFFIGLVLPLRDVGWFIPQLFMAQYLSGRPRYLPTYSAAALMRGVAWLSMAIVLLTQHDRTVLLAGFFVPFIVNSLAGGIGGLPFMEVVAKTIPTERRGGFFGTRLLLSGALGIAASVVVQQALAEQLGRPFPANIGQLTALGAGFAVAALLAFTFVVEPEGEIGAQVSLPTHLGRAARVARRDVNFRLFLATRVALMLAQMATPFLAVYAVRELGAGAGLTGGYLAASTAAAVLSNLVWSRVSDRLGNRLVMRLAASLGLTMMVVALLVGLVGAGLALTSAGLLFMLVFALAGAFQSGVSVGGMSLLIEISPLRDRGLYIGLANSVLGIALLATTVGGLLVDWLGYRGLFLISAGCYAAGFWAASRLREPRQLSDAVQAAGQ